MNLRKIFRYRKELYRRENVGGDTVCSGCAFRNNSNGKCLVPEDNNDLICFDYDKDKDRSYNIIFKKIYDIS